ncbi:MAG: hypothetical protein ACK4K7_11060 [Allosphingosinicella sp.]|uniref:hypothetical protein n=1 Tax=Allosphingosinicella sp. TaxID=2823234 RepID=UPI0039388EF5
MRRPELLLLAALAGCSEAPESTAVAEPAAESPASVVPPPPAMAEPAPPSPSLDGYVLHGLLAGGAVLSAPGQGQTFVPVGRTLPGGLTLAAVAQDHALFTHPGGEIRLGFADAEPSPPSTPSAQQASAPEGGARAEDKLAYRLAFEPRRDGGRIAGFTLRPGAPPVLARAGLLPGDVLLSVNGQAFDSEEKVLELHDEIAGSVTSTFEIERGGRRMTRTLVVNPR